MYMSDATWSEPMLYLPAEVCRQIANNGAVPEGLGERLRFIAHVIINLACQRIMFSQSLVMIEQTTQKLLRAGENLQTCCVTRQIIFPTSSIIARIKSDPLVDELLGL